MSVDVRSRMLAAVVVEAQSTAREARDAAEAARVGFVVAAVAGHPVGVLSGDELAALPAGAVLADAVAAQALVTLEPEELEADEVVALALAVRRGNAPGLVVLEEGVPAGVVPLESLVEAISLRDVVAARERMYGDPTVGTRVFVCRTCEPPTRHRPRSGFDAPVCPRDPAHGPMTREAG